MVQGWEIQYIMVYMLSARVHTFELEGGGGHSAPKEAHFRNFLIVSETVFVVLSVILIHILILFLANLVL